MMRTDDDTPGMSATPPASTAGLLICEHCDTVYRRRPLASCEVACCERCHAVLESHHRIGPNGLLAMTVTAMIVFVQANIWPIVTLQLNGRQSSATLWGTIITMWDEHAQVVAVLAALTLFFLPLAKMLLFGWVFWFARRGVRGPGFRGAMITLHYLRPWTMSEVFVLGALVAIVKARVYFEVIPDPGIFAYGVLTLLITVFGTVDLRQLWDITVERRA